MKHTLPSQPNPPSFFLHVPLSPPNRLPLPLCLLTSRSCVLNTRPLSLLNKRHASARSSITIARPSTSKPNVHKTQPLSFQLRPCLSWMIHYSSKTRHLCHIYSSFVSMDITPHLSLTIAFYVRNIPSHFPSSMLPHSHTILLTLK